MCRNVCFLAGLAIGNLLYAGDLTLCLENQAKVDRDTLTSFEKELKQIAEHSGRSLAVVACEEAGSEVVRVAIKTHSTVEVTALGAARTDGARILPELEIYIKPIAGLLFSNLPCHVGRAMARVAAHEIGHYLMQSRSHGTEVMAEVFTGPRLIAGDARQFRIPIPGE